MLTWDDEVTSQIRRVVETAHYPDLPFTIMQIKPNEEGELECKSYHCTYSEHVARMKADGLELYEAYFAPCASNDSSMRIGNYIESWAVAVDFDHGLPDLCLPGQPLAPTIVIATSVGRSHCIWQLTEPIPAHRMGRLAKVMAKRLGGDMAFARANQMVRLPRFRNRKYGTAVLLREDLCSGTEYSPDFLWKACDGALYEAGIAISSPQVNHIHPHVLRDSPDITLKHARAAVDHLKSRRHAENYATWFKVLVNLAPLGHEGRLIALAFSEGSPKFDADAFEKKWSSVCKNGNGAPSTLFAMAQKEGWKNPGWSDSDGGGEPARSITDREFGALAANEMAETVVALDGEPGARGMTTQFYAWDGMTNRSLTPRQKRAYVATAAAAVIKRGRQAGGEASWAAHEKKLGSNKLLEEVCEHVSEALVPLSEPRIVSGSPYLPVANGVVNLLTRQLVPSDYRAIARASAPVSFNPSAQADRFLRFLNEVLQDDKAMIAYLLRVLGYALLGDPREQVMFILLGPSGNGKSTLMEVMLALLGPLAGRLRTETLMQKSHVNDGANPGLAKLKGTRILVIAEPNRTHKLDTSLVKQLTGEKRIFVRGLYSGGEEITIESCLFMTANFMPYAEAQDKALWRRIRVIPFERTFSPDQINRNLTEELKAEGSGILNLLLSGLADYMSQGLNPPEKVVQAVGALQQAADAFEVFVQECCTLDHMQRIELKVLWAAYQDWAKANSKFRVLTKAEVTERLQERFERVTRGNLPVFVGLTLAGA